MDEFILTTDKDPELATHYKIDNLADRLAQCTDIYRIAPSEELQNEMICLIRAIKELQNE